MGDRICAQMKVFIIMFKFSLTQCSFIQVEETNDTEEAFLANEGSFAKLN